MDLSHGTVLHVAVSSEVRFSLAEDLLMISANRAKYQRTAGKTCHDALAR